MAYPTLTTPANERADGALDVLYTAGHEADLSLQGSGHWPTGQPRRCARRWCIPSPLRPRRRQVSSHSWPRRYRSTHERTPCTSTAAITS